MKGKSDPGYREPTQQERAALNRYFGGITQDLGTDWIRKHLGLEIANEFERTGAILAILSRNAETLLEAEKMLQEGKPVDEVRNYLLKEGAKNGAISAVTAGFATVLGVAVDKLAKIPAVQQAIKTASKVVSEKISNGLGALKGLVKNGGKAASAKDEAAIRNALDELSKLAKKNDDLAKELGGSLDEIKGLLGPLKGWKSTNKWDTSANSKLLRENMGGGISKGEDAHHIVQSTHSRAAAARKLLDDYQIDINDATNGVGLPSTSHHGQGLHSYDGIKAVTRRLEVAVDGIEDWAKGRAAILNELAKIKREILNGDFP